MGIKTGSTRHLWRWHECQHSRILLRAAIQRRWWRRRSYSIIHVNDAPISVIFVIRESAATCQHGFSRAQWPQRRRSQYEHAGFWTSYGKSSAIHGGSKQRGSHGYAAQQQQRLPATSRWQRRSSSFRASAAATTASAAATTSRARRVCSRGFAPECFHGDGAAAGVG